MKKSTKSVLVSSGILVTGAAAFVATIRGVTKKLVGIAMDREMPKNMEKGREKLRRVPKISEFLEAMEVSAENLKQCGCEEVEIVNREGLHLKGHWFECKDAKRVIVAMHGWRSSWAKDFGIISEFWHNNGCSVLYAEQRGQNNSDGEYMGFGMLERYDCLEWVHWVNERTEGKLPIYLGGASMGATTVLMTAGLELPENVHGIVADCGFTSPHAIWKHVVENNLHLPYGMCEAAAEDLCKKKIQLGAKDYSAVEAMEVCKVPVLFIHGTDDHFVPVQMTYENYKACAAQKRLFVVPGADHGMSYYVDKEGYEKCLLEFWQEYDKK